MDSSVQYYYTPIDINELRRYTEFSTDENETVRDRLTVFFNNVSTV